MFRIVFSSSPVQVSLLVTGVLGELVFLVVIVAAVFLWAALESSALRGPVLRLEPSPQCECRYHGISVRLPESGFASGDVVSRS